MNQSIKNQFLCGVLLIAIAIIMFLLNCNTSLYLDDWYYAFNWSTHTKLNSISEIFASQWVHYFVQNGRYPVHFIVQLFDGILGKDMFNVFNTLFFVWFICIISLVITRDKKSYFKVMSVAFVLVFVMMKGFKDSFLWLSGSVNYLWVATLVLIFHLFLMKDEVPRWSIVPLLILSFFSGWSSEVFVVGLGAAYFFFFLTHRKQFSGHRVLMMVAFYLGAALLVFAPGSINRAFYGDTLMRYSLLLKFVHMYNVAIFYLLLLFFLYKVLFDRHDLGAWIKREQFWFMALGITFCFVWISGALPDRTRFGIELFSLIIILHSINWNKIQLPIVVMVDILVVTFACCVIFYCNKYYQSIKEELAQVEAGNAIIATTQPDMPPFIHRYALEYNEYDTDYDFKMYGNSRYISMYYGLDTVTFLPKPFLDDVKRNLVKYDQSFRSFGRLPFYAKRLPQGQKVNAAYLNYDAPCYVSWPQSLHPLFMRLTGEPQESVNIGFKMVYIEGNQFLLIHRTWPDQDKRLKSIRLE